LAAAARHISFVTHDSDAIPGLANRIIARWAAVHAVALPKEVYAYPAAKTITVGVPVQGDFVPVTPSLKAQYRRELGLDKFEHLIFVTGGGNGAQPLNEAVVAALPELLDEFPDLAVVQAVGRQHETAVQKLIDANLTAEQRGRVFVKGYINDLYRYSGAADVIIMRAGATNLAEFALQGKACILVPNPRLTGAHQTKNAQYLASQHAVEIVDETELKQDDSRLMQRILDVLNDEHRQAELAVNIAKLAHVTAAHDLAMLLLEQANAQHKNTHS
jgi:UDP-N-acetylglucosamine--N-acetylmuramyl-(pentapeptide) pyrophosphoryl-undecaprenol N-acetylglucosamine transferase